MFALCWSLLVHYYNGRWQFDCLQLEKQVILYSPSCQVILTHSTESSWQCGLAPIFNCFDACVTSAESEMLQRRFSGLCSKVFIKETNWKWAVKPGFLFPSLSSAPIPTALLLPFSHPLSLPSPHLLFFPTLLGKESETCAISLPERIAP